jgi:hypothetical protein
MNSIPFDILSNVAFGILALSSTILSLYYRKHLVLYKGVAILLFAAGSSSLAKSAMIVSDTWIACVIYYSSRAFIPIFLVVFAEYILKVSFHITIKLIILTLSWVFLIASFFQLGSYFRPFTLAHDIFFSSVLILLTIRVALSYATSNEILLKRFLLIFLCTLISVVVIESLGNFNPYFTAGLSALAFTHGIVLISSTGGYNHLKHKLAPLLYILLFGVTICLLLKLLHFDISRAYLLSLLVITISVLSFLYIYREISISPKSVASSLLISRLLKLPLHDQDKLFSELRKWDEISELHLIHHEGNGDTEMLNSLFLKVGRAIHKYQLNSLHKIFSIDSLNLTGIEVAQFYLKKFDCQSLLQISDKGHFIALKYANGINPALYAHEISLMTKIVYLASNNSKQG